MHPPAAVLPPGRKPQAAGCPGDTDLGQVQPSVVAVVAIAALQQRQSLQAAGGGRRTEGTTESAVRMDQVLPGAALWHVAGDEAMHAHATVEGGLAGDLQRIGAECDHQLCARLLGVVALDGAGGVAGGEEYAAAVDHVADHARRAAIELQAGRIRIGLAEDGHVGTDHATVLQCRDAAFDAGGTGIAVVAGQHQSAPALLDRAAAADDVVAPRRTAGGHIHVGNHIPSRSDPDR